MVGDNLRQLQVGLERLVKACAPTPRPGNRAPFSAGLRGQNPHPGALNGACHVLPAAPAHRGGHLFGVALEHLMDELNRNLIKTTPQQRAIGGRWCT